MIHRTSPFVFFGSPSPFRRAALLVVVCPYLPALPSLRIDSRAHDIPAGHSRSLCLPSRPFSSRFSLTSIDFPRSFVLSFAQRALGDSSSLKLSSAGRWVTKDFIAAFLAPRNVREICVHVRVIAKENDAFYFKLATPSTRDFLSLRIHYVCL